MNETALQVYLTDHLGALAAERELVKRVLAENEHSPWAGFLKGYRPEVDEHYQRLEQLIERLGYPKNALKEATGWLLEKLGRLKINDSLTQYSPLSRLVEFEALTAAAQMRYSLWSSLEAAEDAMIRPLGDFAAWCQEAQRHLERLEEERRRAASLALRLDKKER